MTAGARRRSGWVALVVTLLARMLLGVLASLLLWATLPAALGWHPTVVMTGSMLPRLVPGDVVFSRPVPAADLQLGQTLLYDDPDRPGHLRMHRWVDVAADGRLITRGDANPGNDSTPVARSAVEGVASLRIPFLARPVVWASEGRHVPLVLTTLGLLAAVLAACWFRAVDEDDDTATDDATPAAAAGDDAGDPPAAGPRRLVRAGAALLVVVGLGATFAGAADAATARFTQATSTPTTGSWTGATYFSCGGAARGSGARFAWPLGETAGSTAADISGNATPGTYAGGVTYGTAGPCGSDGTTGVTLNGTSGTVSTSAAADSLPDLTLQVWFRTASTRGGTLMSLTATTGFILTTDTTSMALGMTTTGALSFGVTAGGTKRITSSGSYRDNVWHLATGVAGAGGMVLYVDGVAVGANSAVTTTAAVSGTPRVGYGDGSDLGTSTYDYFQGSVAFASLYKSSLSAATVLAQYQAAA